LGVVEKELVVAPKFVQRFAPLNINEGETVTLSVRAVGTPIPRITWQKVRVNISYYDNTYAHSIFYKNYYFRMA